MGKKRPEQPTQEVGVTFDAGALVALERGDKRMIALIELLSRRGAAARVPAGVAGQVWRDGARQATLARFFSSPQVEVPTLDLAMARACGELCGASGTADVIDASVVLVAREHGDAIVTCDAADMKLLDPSARLVPI